MISPRRLGTVAFFGSALLGVGLLGCQSLDQQRTQERQVRVMTEQAARAATEKYIEDFSNTLGSTMPLYKTSGNSAPCGDITQAEHLPSGATDPYDYVSFARTNDIPLEKLDEFNSALQRIRAYLDKSGWKVTYFRAAEGKRTITDLKARNPADDFGVSVELLHPERRILVSIGSPCLKHPPGDDTRA